MDTTKPLSQSLRLLELVKSQPFTTLDARRMGIMNCSQRITDLRKLGYPIETTYKAMQAAVTCYKAWLAQRGGAGNLEELNMLAQVRRFFEAHGEARFTDWSRPASNSEGHSPRTINRAGYRKHNTETVQDGRGNDVAVVRTEYYVFPETFKAEVCAGFDYRVVCKLLVKRVCLMPEGKGYTRNERLPGGEGERNNQRGGHHHHQRPAGLARRNVRPYRK